MKRIFFLLLLVSSISYAQFVPMLWKLNGNDLIPTDPSFKISSQYLSMPVLRAVKTADETVNNSTVYQDDDHLVISLSANKTYRFKIWLFCATDATAHFQARITVPFLAKLMLGFIHPTSNSVSQAMSQGDTGVFIGGTNALDSNFPGMAEGTIFVGSTAGNLNVQWAQQTATAYDTKVLKGSYIEVYEVQ